MKQLFISAPGIINPPICFDQVEDEPMLALVQCTGNSAATAAAFIVPNGSRFFKVRVTANFVDANNYALLLSAGYVLPDNGVPIPIEYVIFANGPNGDSITVFLNAGALVDGSTSLSIPCGSGRIISAIGGNLLIPVWGVII
jgi:hypothetical protein